MVQSGIAAVRAAPDDPARILVFAEALNGLFPGGDADTPRRLQAAMDGMVRGLDPGSSLLLRTVSAQLAMPAAAGVEVTSYRGEVVIWTVFPGQPAALAGVRPGDVLVQVDKLPVQGADLVAVGGALRGMTGSTVQLQLRRPGVPGLLTVTAIRQRVSLPTASAAVRDGVAVIRPETFAAGAAGRLDSLLHRCTAEAGGSLRGVVLDLRGNSGGLFIDATAVAGLLLPPGAPIVTLQGRAGALTKIVAAGLSHLPGDMPVVVVVNGRTAAGAEMVAAALGARRAVILGSRTAGGGTIQTVTPLREAGAPYGAVRLTTARMVPPAGPAWQRTGLQPDIPGIPAEPALDALAREEAKPNALPAWPGAPPAANPLRVRLAGLHLPPPTGQEVEDALRVLALLQTP